jgi:hypothetical protein
MNHRLPLTVIVLAQMPPTWPVSYDTPTVLDPVYEATPWSAMIGDHLDVAARMLSGVVADDAGMLLLSPISWADGVDVLTGKLLAFLKYKANWDQEQACPPSVDAIYDAVDFLSFFPQGIPIPKPMVLASGDVALYWDDGDIYAEIGFDGSHTYYAYAERLGITPVHLDDEPIKKGFPPAVLAVLVGGGDFVERAAA